MTRNTLHALVAATTAALLAAACSDQPLPTEAAPSNGVPPSRSSPNLVALGYTDLGTLGGVGGVAFSVNRLGQVAGRARNSGGEMRAFVWNAGAMQNLGTLGGTYSEARAVNSTGVVVGVSSTTSGETRGFVWRNGIMQELGTLGGSQSQAFGINDKGQIVGSSTTTADAETHAVLWQDGVIQDLGTLGGTQSVAGEINEAGQIVGSSTTATSGANRHAFIWQNGVMQDLGTNGAESSSALGINESGWVVGLLESSGEDPRGFAWSGSAMYTLVSIGAAEAINNMIQMVGFRGTDTDPMAVASYDTFELLGALGGTASQAFDVNDVGQAVGWAETPTGEHRPVLWTIAIEAPIDIVPGDATNKIKLTAKGQLSVAILGSPYFDATRVDPGSLALGNFDGNDTPVSRDRKLVPQVTRKDVDRDGDMDVVAMFDQPTMVQHGDLTASTTRLTLSGALSDGKRIRSVRLVTVTP